MLARVLACGHTAPLDQPCPVCGPTPAKRAESARKRERAAWQKVYNTPRWRKVRREVLKRDRFTCQDCGARATVAAHLRPFDPDDEAAFDPRNLKASCVSCNSREASNRYHATKGGTSSPAAVSAAKPRPTAWVS